MKMNTLDALFEDQIKDLYSAENQLVKALPKLAKKATSPALKQCFTSHLEQTKGHVARLEEIGADIGIKLGGKKCHAMMGLIEEGGEVIDAEGSDPVIDAALVAAAQRVEHYEISAYGTARTLAEQVGNKRAAKLLQQTLEEESAADSKLTKICEGELYPEAAQNREEAVSNGRSASRR